MLWAWFEEDHILSRQLAQPRLHSDDQVIGIIRTHPIPYGIFENTDDVTTGKPDQLAARLESVLAKVWCLNNG